MCIAHSFWFIFRFDIKYALCLVTQYDTHFFVSYSIDNASAARTLKHLILFFINRID